MSQTSKTLQSHLFNLPANEKLRTENHFLAHRVHCLQCGKIYIPSQSIRNDASIHLNVPPIMANNFCGRTCYERSFESLSQNILSLSRDTVVKTIDSLNIWRGYFKCIHFQNPVLDDTEKGKSFDEYWIKLEEVRFKDGSLLGKVGQCHGCGTVYIMESEQEL